LFRAIRDDGRGEDDVLIVGDFHGGESDYQPIWQSAGLTSVGSNRPNNRPTNTLDNSQFDNLIFSELATIEFTGRGGVFDFMRHYNMRLDDALQISKQMPVWAEFSVFEGAVSESAQNQSQTPGRVADGELSTTR
jgi:deoxyribonuclease-1-like protein